MVEAARRIQSVSSLLPDLRITACEHMRIAPGNMRGQNYVQKSGYVGYFLGLGDVGCGWSEITWDLAGKLT